MIQPLEFGGFILLKPEILSRYAAALVRKVRKHPQELGCILEEDLLAGNLDYQDFERLPHEDETIILRAALHQTVVGRAWCLRQPCDNTSLLTFPNYSPASIRSAIRLENPSSTELRSTRPWRPATRVRSSALTAESRFSCAT